MQSNMSSGVSTRFRVVIHTIGAVLTCVCIAVGVFFFVSGSQLFATNRERGGVRIERTMSDGETYIFGTFSTRSECTQVNVSTEVEDVQPVVYLTEEEDGTCVLYQRPLPYTFTAVFDGTLRGPVRVYMNGDSMPTTEHN